MEIKELDIEKIVANPLQPRQEFDNEKIQELANSIKESELLQPIVVRLKGKNYEIVAGERRFKAFQILKETKIPTIIRNIKDDTDALEKSLVENWQRDDLTSIERENAVYKLWKSGRYKTHTELAKKLGVSIRLIGEVIESKKFRENSKAASKISTRTLVDTAQLQEEPRKKIIKQVETGKLEASKVRDVVRKVKEFPESEQQLEILEEFEQQEEASKDMLDEIVRKKKDIIEGKRPPELKVILDKDRDMQTVQEYRDIKIQVFEIYYDHINHFKNEKAKQEAIKILWDIYNFTAKQLFKLGVLKVIAHD